MAKFTSHTEFAKVVQNCKDKDAFGLGGREFRKNQLERTLGFSQPRRGCHHGRLM